MEKEEGRTMGMEWFPAALNGGLLWGGFVVFC